MKTLLKGIIVVGYLIFFNNSAFAQTQDCGGTCAWGAGQLRFSYASGNCGGVGVDAPSYDFELRMYIDDLDLAWPVPNNLTVFYFRVNANNVPIDINTVQVSRDITTQKKVTQYCLRGNPVATESSIYRPAAPIALETPDIWHIAYFGQYRSVEYQNIRVGQSFFVEGTIDTRCGDVIGTRYDPQTQTYLPAQEFNDIPMFNSTSFVFDDPVASFCVDSTFTYEFKPVVGQGVDLVSFKRVPVLRAFSNQALYNAGFNAQTPFPNRDLRTGFDSLVGSISFTPERSFTSLVNIEVREHANRWYTLDPSEDPNQELRFGRQLISTSDREYRFLFDDDCNPRIPEFKVGEYREANLNVGDSTFFFDYDPLENAYLLDCGPSVLTLELSEPVTCFSLAQGGYPVPSGKGFAPLEQQDLGFRIASVDINDNYLDDVPIRVAIPSECDEAGEFSIIRLYTDKIDPRTKVQEGIGPGKYALYMKVGDDSTTLINRCNNQVPPNDTLAYFIVKDEFTYVHDFIADMQIPSTKQVKRYCYPNEPIPEIKVSNQYLVPDFMSWIVTREDPRPGNFNPTANDDTIYYKDFSAPKELVVDDPFNPDWYEQFRTTPTSDDTIPAGWWILGVGYDFSTYDPVTGAVLRSRTCYDEDVFFIDTVGTVPVRVPDYDLCKDEDWPVISFDTLDYLVNGEKLILENSWEWFKVFDLPSNNGNGLIQNTDLISTTPYNLDLVKSGQIGIWNNYYVEFTIAETGCRIREEFRVRKSIVLVELADNDGRIFGDTTVCLGEEFTLKNTTEEGYTDLDAHTYQWYLDGDSIIGADSANIDFDRSGFYKLEVTRTTDNFFCTGSDSVYVRVAQQLPAVNPICDRVTFNNGNVEQTFKWDPIDNAAFYEVRGVTEFDENGENGIYREWESANQSDSISHLILGQRVGVQVRSINEGVVPTAYCYYSDTAFAEPCEIVVRPTNVFTPNGDGINEFLAFDLVEVYPGSFLQIYDRWGNLIFEDPDYFNDWDGEDYQEGTYFYILDINDPEGVQELMKGTFTIIRD